jgi:hypothetical protein
MIVENDIFLCSYRIAKYAVCNWHYSRSMPSGRIIKFGIKENGKFIGTILYSKGANKNIHKPYNLPEGSVCELTRIAFITHKNPLSFYVSKTLSMLKNIDRGLYLVVSYSDRNQGHEGTIYKACNFIYEGEFANEIGILINGKLIHRRTVSAIYGTSALGKIGGKSIRGKAKSKWLYPLNKKTRKAILKKINANKTAKKAK